MSGRAVAAAPLRAPRAAVQPTAVLQRTAGQSGPMPVRAETLPVPARDAGPAAMAPQVSLSPEVVARMDADVEFIVRILKGGSPDAGEQTEIINRLRGWTSQDDALKAQAPGLRATPMLDHFLIRLKMRSFPRSSAKTLWQDQYAIVYDALWYELRGAWLETFKHLVQRSQTERTSGPRAADLENGAALLARQEAMGMWGMLKGLGTGLVGLAGPQAAAAMAAQFDETARILFGSQWDSSEALVLGMNAGQIGTVGGDVIWQLVMLARSLGAKGGKVLELAANLDKFKKAQQLLGVLGGLQGVGMAAQGIARVIEARQKAGLSLALPDLMQDNDFLDQVAMLASSLIGTATAAKGAPSSPQQLVTRARVAALLGALQASTSLKRLADVAASDLSPAEKTRAYGEVLAGLIPQITSLLIDSHGVAQARREARRDAATAAPAGEPKNPQAKPPASELANAAPAAAKVPPADVSASQGPAPAATDPGADRTMTGSHPSKPKASASPATPEPARASLSVLEQRRDAVAQAHQTRLSQEVAETLGPRQVPTDAQALPLPPFKRPGRSGSVTVGEALPTLDTARHLYDRVIAETGGQREVGIWQHPDTGEYIVRLGQSTSVGPPPGGVAWRAVQHLHTNVSDVPLWRMPAQRDVALLAESVQQSGRTLTELVEFPLPDGRRGQTAYTVTPSGELEIQTVGLDGERKVKRFARVQDFDDYHGVRKVMDNDVARQEVDQWLAARRAQAEREAAELGVTPGATPSPGERTMTGRQAPSDAPRAPATEGAKAPVALDKAGMEAQAKALSKQAGQLRKRQAKRGSAAGKASLMAVEAELKRLDDVLRHGHLDPLRSTESLPDYAERAFGQRPNESLADYRDRLAFMDAAIVGEADAMEQRGGPGEAVLGLFMAAREDADQRAAQLDAQRGAHAALVRKADDAREALRQLRESRRLAGLGRADAQGNQAPLLEAESQARQAREQVEASSKARALLENPARPGDFGEHQARRYIVTHALGSNPRAIQNASGHGIDIVADMPPRDGIKQYLFAEVKEESARLSDAQKDPNAFVLSRLEASDQLEARRILHEIQSGQAVIARTLLIRVSDISKASGTYRIQHQPWTQGGQP